MVIPESPRYNPLPDLSETAWYEHIEKLPEFFRRLGAEGLQAIRGAAVDAPGSRRKVEQQPLLLPDEITGVPMRLNPDVIGALRSESPSKTKINLLLGAGVATLALARGAAAVSGHPRAVRNVAGRGAWLALPVPNPTVIERRVTRRGGGILLSQAPVHHFTVGVDVARVVSRFAPVELDIGVRHVFMGDSRVAGDHFGLRVRVDTPDEPAGHAISFEFADTLGDLPGRRLAPSEGEQLAYYAGRLRALGDAMLLAATLQRK